MALEKAKPVGAVGALVSSSTSWVWIVEMLPTLSSAIHFTVVVPGVVTSKLAAAALTTVAVPLVVGSVPSVVYVICLTPDAPLSPPAAMSTVTGAAVYQPAEQPAPLHWTELVGALPSALAVKDAVEPVSPAPFVAEMVPAAVEVAELVKV